MRGRFALGAIRGRWGLWRSRGWRSGSRGVSPRPRLPCASWRGPGAVRPGVRPGGCAVPPGRPCCPPPAPRASTGGGASLRGTRRGWLPGPRESSGCGPGGRGRRPGGNPGTSSGARPVGRRSGGRRPRAEGRGRTSGSASWPCRRSCREGRARRARARAALLSAQEVVAIAERSAALAERSGCFRETLAIPGEVEGYPAFAPDPDFPPGPAHAHSSTSRMIASTWPSRPPSLSTSA